MAPVCGRHGAGVGNRFSGHEQTDRITALERSRHGNVCSAVRFDLQVEDKTLEELLVFKEEKLLALPLEETEVNEESHRALAEIVNVPVLVLGEADLGQNHG